MSEKKTEPVVGECGGCGTVTEVVDYFGDCICRACAAEEAEDWPAQPNREPPAAPPCPPLGGRTRQTSRGGSGGPIGR